MLFKIKKGILVFLIRFFLSFMSSNQLQTTIPVKRALFSRLKRFFVDSQSQQLDMKKIMHKNDAAERRHHLESIRRQTQEMKKECLALSSVATHVKQETMKEVQTMREIKAINGVKAIRSNLAYL